MELKGKLSELRTSRELAVKENEKLKTQNNELFSTNKTLQQSETNLKDKLSNVEFKLKEATILVMLNVVSNLGS